MLIGLALAIGFHVAAPAIGAWLASVGVTSPWAMFAISNLGPGSLEKLIRLIPSGPLTPAQRAIVQRDRARRRQDLGGPMDFG